MDEEFYAVIKLVSGEEILSKVSPCEEEDRILLILDNPVVMNQITIKHLNVSALKVEPWLKLTTDSMFIMNMDKVITMTEIKDQGVIKIYKKFLRDKNRSSQKIKVTSNMGYLTSVKEARKFLEKLYDNDLDN